MAEPLLDYPSSWTRVTLEPKPEEEFIVRVESGTTPRTSEEEYWDGDEEDLGDDR